MLLRSMIEETPDEVRVTLTGEIDTSVSGVLHDVLFNAVDKHRRVRVDLDGLVLIDSTGIATLLAALHAAAHHGHGLYVVHAQGIVHRVLTIAGVLDALTDNDPTRPTRPQTPHADSA